MTTPDREQALGGCPKRGEIRIISGNVCRFIERELEGDKWEVLGPAPVSTNEVGDE